MLDKYVTSLSSEFCELIDFTRFLWESSFSDRDSLYQVRSECLTCAFRASCCSARLSRAHVPAFAGSSVSLSHINTILKSVQWRSRGYCRPGPNIYGRPYWCSRNTFAARNCRPCKGRTPSAPPPPAHVAPPLYPLHQHRANGLNTYGHTTPMVV